MYITEDWDMLTAMLWYVHHRRLGHADSNAVVYMYTITEQWDMLTAMLWYVQHHRTLGHADSNAVVCTTSQNSRTR